MVILATGNTFATNQQVTATTLNNAVNNATFASGAVDNTTTQLSGGAVIVKDAGITPAKLSTGGPSWDSSGNLTVPGDVSVGDDLTVTDAATIGGLLDISAATAGQVKFPATQNASSDANTLDDYEEGTWTPSLGGTATYTTQTGTYTKIGRQVNVRCHLKVNAIGSGSATTISGLPFAPSANTAGTVGFFTGSANGVVFLTCYTSGSTIVMSGILAFDTATSTISFFTSGTEVILSITYSV